MTGYTWTTRQTLNTPMPDNNDAGATTIGHYLSLLLAGVWKHREIFNGKRPFGNSSWEYDIYDALAAAGFVHAPINEHGQRDYTDEQIRDMDRLIDNTIANMAS